MGTERKGNVIRRVGKLVLMVSICILVLRTVTTQGMEEDPMNHVPTFTEAQQTILRAAGVPERRLESHILINSEKELLSAFDAAQSYLNMKYPEKSFTFIGLDNSIMRNGRYQFIAKEKSEPEENFAVRSCRSSSDENWQISESYFALLKRKELNELIQQHITSYGFETKTDLEIVGLYDETWSAVIPLKEMLESNRQSLSISGWAFLSGEETLTKLSADLPSVLRAMGMCGGFRVLRIEKLSVEEALLMPRTDRSFIKEEIYLSLPEEIVR